MTHIEIRSKVGPDGVLKLAVAVGMGEANREVKITVESAGADTEPPSLDPRQWKRFVEEMAGSISDPTFKRQEQGEFELRGKMFP